MEFRISDTFTSSLAKLTNDEQKAVKTTAFDLQLNPANPGMKFHRLDKAKDQNFWSVRVSKDVRLIVHRTEASLLLCYVDHHDGAYRWAERRKIERHPKTGAAQIVEVRETVQEIAVPKYVEQEVPEQQPVEAALFSNVSRDDLTSYGVPEEWVDDVLVATESNLFDLTEHLPQEAAEALLELATGGAPKASPVIHEKVDSFEHPDAKRRFRVMTNMEELERALEYPWDKWSIFLHPAQRDIVESYLNGPARISGSAGTGKTVVALHRAVYLARNYPEARVLLTTFSETLANALSNQLLRLISGEPRLAERLEVHSIEEIGRRLYERNFATPNIATEVQIREMLSAAAKTAENLTFSPHFIWAEWSNVIDAWQLNGWEEYRDIIRLGRKKRLTEPQRESLWRIFEKVQQQLTSRNLLTQADMFVRVAERISNYTNPPFDFVVVDESQDMGVAELRFLAALGNSRENGLFFTGDLGQRIFQQPFSWKALGIEIRGRSKTLRINYRTSHQIRSYADRLLPEELSDVDGVSESRGGTISIFNGPSPEIQTFDTPEAEVRAVSTWITDRLAEGFQPHEFGLFVRAPEQLPRARDAVNLAQVLAVELNEKMKSKTGHMSVCTMHLAKGLEFRAVVVMACDDEIVPLQERLESAPEESDLEDVYQTERHLLYVASTRARDRLLVTGVNPASEFLDDLREVTKC